MNRCHKCQDTTAPCNDCVNRNLALMSPTPLLPEYTLFPPPQPTQTPFCCPVCKGNGLVPNGFYAQTSGAWGSTTTEPETCRSCTGTGIVWR